MKKNLFWIVIALMAAGCTLQDGNDLAKACGSSDEPLQFIQLPNGYVCYPEGCPDCPFEGDESVLCKHYIFNDAFGQNRCPTSQFECITEGSYVPYCKIITKAQTGDACVNYSNQCIGNSLRVCTNNEFIEIPCDNEGKICANINGKATCADSCSDKDNKCRDGVLSICHNHLLLNEQCGEDEKCGTRDGEPACLKGCKVQDKILSSGDRYCEDDTLVSCADGQLKTEKCPDGLCENDMCTLTACDGVPNGETRCNEDILEKCIDGEFVAISDSCFAECEDGNIKCDGETNYFVCVDGHWASESTPCPDNSKCTESDGISRCTQNVVCENDEIRCVDTDESKKSFNLCQNGQWSVEVFSCDDDKYCDEDACVPLCLEGMTQCSDQKIRTCQSDGMMGEPQDCERRFSCQAGKCQCINGAMQCGKDDDKEFIQACVNGSWFKGDECPHGCNDEPDDPVCYPCSEDTFQCTDKGMIQLCRNHQWIDVENCGQADVKKSVCHGSEGDKQVGCACKEGDTRCSEDGKSLEICTVKEADPDGNKVKNPLTYLGWKKVMDCLDKCEMKSDKASCSCKEKDAQFCTGNVLSTCVKGTWELQTCAENTFCDAKTAQCQCIEGEYLCDTDATKRKVCKNGSWTVSACEESEKCIPEEGGVCRKQSQLCGADSEKVVSMCIQNHVVDCQSGTVTLCKGELSCKTSPAYKTIFLNIATIEKLSASCASKTVALQDECRQNHNFSSDQRCFNQEIQTCSNNSKFWTNKTNCESSGNICIETLSLNKEDNPIGIAAACNNKVCDFQDVRCNGDKIEFCGNNKWISWGDCTSVGRKCENGHCVKK